MGVLQKDAVPESRDAKLGVMARGQGRERFAVNAVLLEGGLEVTKVDGGQPVGDVVDRPRDGRDRLESLGLFGQLPGEFFGSFGLGGLLPGEFFGGLAVSALLGGLAVCLRLGVFDGRYRDEKGATGMPWGLITCK